MDKIYHCFYTLIHRESSMLNKKYDTKVCASDEEKAREVALKEVLRIFPLYIINLDCIKELKPSSVVLELHRKNKNKEEK